MSVIDTIVDIGYRIPMSNLAFLYCNARSRTLLFSPSQTHIPILVMMHTGTLPIHTYLTLIPSQNPSTDHHPFCCITHRNPL